MTKKSTADPATEKRLKESYIKHATLAQLHRWWQFYENPDTGLANHLNLLSKNVLVQSISGEAIGLRAYENTIQKMPSPSKNAHFLKASVVDIAADGEISLNAEADYFNVGLLPNDGAPESTIAFEATLQCTNTVLPEFTKVHIAKKDSNEAFEYKDAFHKNRIRSLVHYFTALVEDPTRNPEPFQEALASEFSLHYTETPISDFEGIRDWVAGPLSSVVASNHQINDVSYEILGDGDYFVTISMASQAMFPDGSGITSNNTQTWTLCDDIHERFARIKKITIDRDEVRRF